MAIELADVKRYLEDNLQVELNYDPHTETINVDILLDNALICDSSMPLPKPKLSWN